MKPNEQEITVRFDATTRMVSIDARTMAGFCAALGPGVIKIVEHFGVTTVPSHMHECFSDECDRVGEPYLCEITGRAAIAQKALKKLLIEADK